MAKRKTPRKLTAEKKRRVAYHEAGHAVAHILLRKRLKAATIVPDPGAGSLGHVDSDVRGQNFRPDMKEEISGRTRSRLERDIMVDLAGIEAEKIVYGRNNRQGARGDFISASSLARFVAGDDKEAVAYTAWLQARIGNKLRVWPTNIGLKAVADALIKHETLSGRRCRDIFHAARNGAVAAKMVRKQPTP